jgi:phage N-6-adenine-methyltransferase
MSVFDDLNALEVEAAKGDDARFDQAAEVVRLREAGQTQQAIADNWLKRNGEPYSQQHVAFVEKIGRHYQDSNWATWTDAWNWAVGRGAHVGANAGDNEWYTPLEYIEAARQVLGRIDLDPASTAEANEVVRARRFFTEDDDGLAQSWRGRIWMNPPYAQPLIDEFCTKLAEEYETGNVAAAITLTNNATETAWFHVLAGAGSAVAFPRGRVKFWHPRKESVPLQGQAVVYLGPDVEAFRREFEQFGFTAVMA